MMNVIVGLSQQARNHLTTIKRRTGVSDDAALLRWALCTSLSIEPTPYRVCQEPVVYKIAWYQLGGSHQELLLAYLKYVCAEARQARDLEELAACARFHVQRGLAHIHHHSDIRSAVDLVKLIDLDLVGGDKSLPKDAELDS
jgi:DNA sulfur modification protein DndE